MGQELPRKNTAGKELSTGGPSSVVKDPVCGMDVNTNNAGAYREFDGQRYYFCRDSCLEKFQAGPAKFTAQAQASTQPKKVEATKGGYTCPMHPEVRQPEPGSCPKCGMALEPRTAVAEEEGSAELRDMKRRS